MSGSGKKQSFDLIVDVRSRVEFFFGHLPSAVCIPVTQLPADLQNRTDVNERSRILVYCASGARSAAAAAQLRAVGFTNVVDGGSLTAAKAFVSD